MTSTLAERADLRDVVRRYIAKTAPLQAVRSIAETGGYDQEHWRRLSEELGLQALPISEAYGGAGGSLGDLVVVMEEQGRALHCSPYFSSVVLAGGVLAASGDVQACARSLPGIANGSRLVTLAAQELAGGWCPEAITASAARSAGSWHLTGEKHFVLDAVGADCFLVLARTGPGGSDGAGLGLFEVAADAPGLTVTRLPTLDLTRPQAVVSFAGVPAVPIGDCEDGWRPVRDATLVAGVALAAEQAGAARRALEIAVEYARTRRAFGGVIGGYQAVKHLCAGMWVAVSGAEAAARNAADLRDAGDPGFAVAARIARVYANESFVKVAADAIHVLGGIGFTWEHDAHLFLRRAHADAVLLESSDRLRDQILVELGV